MGGNTSSGIYRNHVGNTLCMWFSINTVARSTWSDISVHTLQCHINLFYSHANEMYTTYMWYFHFPACTWSAEDSGRQTGYILLSSVRSANLRLRLTPLRTTWLSLKLVLSVIFNVTESFAELSRLALKRNGISRAWGHNKGKYTSECLF